MARRNIFQHIKGSDAEANDQLSHRANGMSSATLRRHLAVLVSCGLVIRRDSPNGKRYARRRPGRASLWLRFVAAPCARRRVQGTCGSRGSRAQGVPAGQRAADDLQARRDQDDRGRNKRDGARQLAGLSAAHRSIVGHLPRTAPRQAIEAVADELEELWSEVHATLESFIESQKLSANESQSERHIQNSNTDRNSTNESEYGSGKRDEANGSATTDNVHSLPKRDLPLGLVLDA